MRISYTATTGLPQAKEQSQSTPVCETVTICGTKVHIAPREVIALTKVVLRPTGSEHGDTSLTYMIEMGVQGKIPRTL